MCMDMHHNVIYNGEKLKPQMSNNGVHELMMVRQADEIPCGH